MNYKKQKQSKKLRISETYKLRKTPLQLIVKVSRHVQEGSKILITVLIKEKLLLES